MTATRGQRDEARVFGSAYSHLARLVVDGRRPGSPKKAEQMLIACLTKKWPVGVSVHTLITPGGFVLTKAKAKPSTKRGWDSRSEDIAAFIRAAEVALDGVLTDRVMAAMRGKASVLTVGVDVESDQRLTAELVAVVNVETRKVTWTGKSYPVPSQTRTLVQVAEVATHLVEVHGERLLVLGCHDLNMFSARSRANQDAEGAPRKRSDVMIRAALRFKPTLVVQHPHVTDTAKTWSVAWGGVRKHLGQTVKAWASGIAYHNSKQDVRQPLLDVLRLTASSPEHCIDIVLPGS